MNQDQFYSIVRTAIKVGGTALAYHGYTTSASTLNGEDVTGAIILIAGAAWSWYHHKTVKE